MKKMKEIFIAGYDVMGKNMAGPGIRSLAIASFLKNHFSVTLSYDSASELENVADGVNAIPEADVQWNNADYWKRFDVAIMPGTQSLKSTLPENFPIPLIVDIYDPYILENIEMLSQRTPQVRDYEYTRHLKAMLEMLLLGDRFIVTSGRAMDFFTGLLAAYGKINPVTSSGDRYEKLFLTIPFGIPDEPFQQSLTNAKTELPGEIKETDELIIWAGGLWDWLDPLSLVESMPMVLEKCPDAKLLFMGYRHPNKHIPLMETAKKCIETAKNLKLEGSRIIFREWTPFSERISILGRANIGVSLHKKHIETRYSFRTRIMDYIWAGIPMLISSGDSLSDELAIPGVIRCEPGASPSEIAKSIVSLLEITKNDAEMLKIKESFEQKGMIYKWGNLLKPLLSSINSIEKLPDDFYSEAFRKTLKSFPTPPKPGIIAKGIDKLKNL